MPQATLTYSLPEDRLAFDAASRADDAWGALYEIGQLCRNTLKHGLPSTMTYPSILEQIRGIIAEARPPE